MVLEPRRLGLFNFFHSGALARNHFRLDHRTGSSDSGRMFAEQTKRKSKSTSQSLKFGNRLLLLLLCSANTLLHTKEGLHLRQQAHFRCLCDSEKRKQRLQTFWIFMHEKASKSCKLELELLGPSLVLAIPPPQ